MESQNADCESRTLEHPLGECLSRPEPSTPASFRRRTRSVAGRTLLWTLGLASMTSATAWAQGTAVLTQHNDNNRSGANLAETTLTVSAVNSDLFAKFFSRAVRGSIYAQPLYVPNVNCPGVGLRNLVYVATMHNHVYAIDISGPSAAPCWDRQFGPSIPLPDNIIGGGAGYRDIWGEVGIVSTPVISQRDNALFFITTTKSGTSYSHIIHKVRLTDGSDILIPITLSAPNFDSAKQIQRASLLLSSGVVYASFAAYRDSTPYHGWVFAFDSSTLKQLPAFNDTAPTPPPPLDYSPAGPAGGIWMSGQGPAADSSNNIYLMTGNGYFNYDTKPPLNMSVLDLDSTFAKLKLDNSRSILTAQSWFAPFNVYNQV